MKMRFAAGHARDHDLDVADHVWPALPKFRCIGRNAEDSDRGSISSRQNALSAVDGKLLDPAPVVQQIGSTRHRNISSPLLVGEREAHIVVLD